MGIKRGCFFLSALITISLSLFAMKAWLYHYLMLHQYKRNKSDITAIHFQTVSLSPYQETLVFRMLDFDFSVGIASADVVEQAKYNAAFYFEQVQRGCGFLTQQSDEFFMCANRLLGQYFYYAPSRELSNTLAKQQSDCDSNSYLIYDIANIMGLVPYVAYSPGHAFVGWKSKDNTFLYLETTLHNNRGGLADLDSGLYIKTDDPAYYSPQMDHEKIFDIYRSVVHKLTGDHSYIEEFSDRKTHALIADSYFSYLLNVGALTVQDVSFLQTQRQLNKGSVTFTMLLVRWYFQNGYDEKAKALLDDIPMDSCLVSKVGLSSFWLCFERSYKSIRL